MQIISVENSIQIQFRLFVYCLGTYEAGIGSITTHPYQYQPTNFSANPMDDHQQSLYSNDHQQTTFLRDDHKPGQQHVNGHSNFNTSKNNEKTQGKNSTRNQTTTKTLRPPPQPTQPPTQKKPVNNQKVSTIS